MENIDYLIIGLVLGFLASYVRSHPDLFKRNPEPWNKNKSRVFKFEPAHNIELYLYRFGNLPDEKIHKLALWVLDKKPFNGYYLERRNHKGGFLTHREYKDVTQDLLDRNLAYIDNRVCTPTLAGYHFILRVGGCSKLANSKQTRKDE